MPFISLHSTSLWVFLSPISFYNRHRPSRGCWSAWITFCLSWFNVSITLVIHSRGLNPFPRWLIKCLVPSFMPFDWVCHMPNCHPFRYFFHRTRFPTLKGASMLTLRPSPWVYYSFASQVTGNTLRCAQPATRRYMWAYHRRDQVESGPILERIATAPHRKVLPLLLNHLLLSCSY